MTDSLVNVTLAMRALVRYPSHLRAVLDHVQACPVCRPEVETYWASRFWLGTGSGRLGSGSR